MLAARSRSKTRRRCSRCSWKEREKTTVVDIDEDEHADGVMKDAAHNPLKKGGCVAQAKRHPHELIQLAVDDEGGLEAIALVNEDLPIAVGRVER